MARDRIQYANHQNLEGTFICTSGHLEGFVFKLIGAYKHGYDAKLIGEVINKKFIPIDREAPPSIIANKQLKNEYKKYKIPKGGK